MFIYFFFLRTTTQRINSDVCGLLASETSLLSAWESNNKSGTTGLGEKISVLGGEL